MKVVTFLKSWRVYNPGQVAGFEPELADQLIEAEVAAAYVGADAEAAGEERQEVAPKVVEFVKAWGVYNPGQVAGFEPDRAAFLIKAGVAVAYGEALGAEVAKVAANAVAVKAGKAKPVAVALTEPVADLGAPPVQGGGAAT